MKLNTLLYLPSFACLFVIAVTGISCKGDGTANSSDPTTMDDDLKKLDKDQFTKEMKRSGSVLIDVRMPQEFEQGHIEGALNISFFDPQFKYKLLELDREKSYYLYDKKESKSFRAMKFMEDNGFTKVRMLKGGWEEWTTVHAPQDTSANK